ncbi:MAG: O-antigen ligase family protein [Sphingomicrobium sp.]
MPSAARSAVAPIYLFACLILGGSAQGIWQNMVLQLAGVAIIVWAATAQSDEPLSNPTKMLLLLAIAAIAWVALQLVPLPPSLWAHGARFRIAEGFGLLGRPVPALPLSLTPYETLTTILCLIPPVAIFCAITRLRSSRPVWLAAALLAGTAAGILLGVLQVATPASPWYLYADTNRGSAVGFFANANHMASLLVICVPFVAALAAAGRSGSIQRYSALLSVLAAAVLVLIVGIALNGSLAGYTLLVPVLAASALMLLPRSSTALRGIAVLVGAVSVIAAVAALASSSIGHANLGQGANTSVQSREQILTTTSKAIADYMPLGSGLGSFVRVYRLNESPDQVSSEYVVHAHDDYVELALELGIPGVILILLFLAWWVAAVWAVWRKWQAGPFARAASIASAAVLVHSLVDFPLRTAAISACFAMCLALLMQQRPPQLQESDDLRPTRHVTVA